MSPPRPSGIAVIPPPRNLGVTFTTSGYEVVKARVLVKLQDRLDALKARRMPASLLAEAARQQADQLIEAESARLSRPDRDKLAREVAEEAFGFGPLEELFADPGVKEITVLGAQAVLVRRGGGWVPSNLRFRDESHLTDVLDKIRGQGEAVAPGLPESVLDVRLGNGFRAVAIVPPVATGAAPLAAFVRAAAPVDVGTSTPAPAASPSAVGVAAGSGGGGTRADSGRFPIPAVPPGTRPPAADPLTDRHRQRITERFIAKLAALGVFDLSGIDSGELRKVIAAYVDEYCRTERIYLTDADKGRVTLEILAGMGR